MVRRVLLVLTSLLCAAGLIACADNGTAPSLPGNADTSGYDGVISGAPTADAATIAASAWATAVKQRGVLNVGGTDAGPLFSLKDPSTGKVTGFDAGLSQMLARYILGDPKTQLTITTVDTRETLLQNATVDAVFATYTITEQRAQKVDFAGPYYTSGDAILVKKTNTSINQVMGRRIRRGA